MFQYIQNNPISFIALIISFVSLFLSIKTFYNQIVRLKITYNTNESLFVNFKYYEEYKIIFIETLIENKSKSDITITSAFLSNKSEMYTASNCEIPDRFNKNGLSLISKENPTRGYYYNINSLNILNNCRLSSYDSFKGYFVFHTSKIISESTKYKLTIHTPNKNFSIWVNVCPLPDNQRTYN